MSEKSSVVKPVVIGVLTAVLTAVILSQLGLNKKDPDPQKAQMLAASGESGSQERLDELEEKISKLTDQDLKKRQAEMNQHVKQAFFEVLFAVRCSCQASSGFWCKSCRKEMSLLLKVSVKRSLTLAGSLVESIFHSSLKSLICPESFLGFAVGGFLSASIALRLAATLSIRFMAIWRVEYSPM